MLNPSPELVMRDFESLGFNCEFGLVQRHFGAEALGLLRWGHVQPGFETLLSMLEHRFEGIGEHIRLDIINGEWVSLDLKYKIVFHTDQRAGMVDEHRLVTTEKRRMRYMAESLLDLMVEGETIFVYKAEGSFGLSDARRLLTAIRAFGGSCLLWVCTTENADRVGCVEEHGDGLMQGYIDRFSPTENIYAHCSFQIWLAICQRARILKLDAKPLISPKTPVEF